MSKRELRFATLLRIGEAAWVPYSSASAGFVGWVAFRTAALPGSGLPVDVLVAPCRLAPTAEAAAAKIAETNEKR